MMLYALPIMRTIMTETEKSTYSRAMIEDAEDFLWKNFGISVGTPEYRWTKDKTIEEATKNGWKFRFY
jgi:hypothetical protein